MPVQRIGGVDHAGDVAIGDEPHRRPRLADRRDQIGMARPVENERRDLGGRHPLGLGKGTDVFLRGASRSTTPLG